MRVGCPRASDTGLLDWIDDELWTCELAGVVDDDGQVLVAERGRLVERVSAWNETAAHDFARACATRGREHVVEALRAEGHEDEARKLGGRDAERLRDGRTRCGSTAAVRDCGPGPHGRRHDSARRGSSPRGP